MARFIIEGGRPLSGTFTPAGNKNAVLPMLAASLLTDQTVTLHNVPDILDVAVMLELLASTGVSVARRGHTVTLCAAGIRSHRLPENLCRRVRSSILLAGPLTARHGRASLAPPGGDVIGRRRIDTHFAGLQALGIKIECGSRYTFRRGRLRGADLLLDEASVTATENILMAASLASGRTTVFNAACEPHVQDLCELLRKMGARIRGDGTNFVTVEGVKALRGATHTVGPDHIELGSFLAAAAATHGSLIVPGAARLPGLNVIQRAMEKLGVLLKIEKGRLVLDACRQIRVRTDFGRAIPKIEDGAWPAFPSDLMSVLIVLATQARGQVLFFEKMFESRMYFVDRLIEMGAAIIQCDPHRVVVAGPSRLQRMHLTTPDIRAGMALLVAALCARGESTIENAQLIDRGYEQIDSRLRALGARIERAD